jgi:hypothetical protein
MAKNKRDRQDERGVDWRRDLAKATGRPELPAASETRPPRPDGHPPRQQGGANAMPEVPSTCKFIYPYNFVSPPELEGKPAPGRDGAPDHSRCLVVEEGRLSGRIEYTLRTLTPLFIPDPKLTITLKDPEHKVMRFFEIDGKLAIPGSSIRGMIRSLAEAVTGSSVAHSDAWDLHMTSRTADGANRHKYGLLANGGAQVKPLMRARATITEVARLLRVHHHDELAARAEAGCDIWFRPGAGGQGIRARQLSLTPGQGLKKGQLRVRRNWVHDAEGRGQYVSLLFDPQAPITVDKTAVDEWRKAHEADVARKSSCPQGEKDLKDGAIVCYETGHSGQVTRLDLAQVWKVAETRVPADVAKALVSWNQPTTPAGKGADLCPVSRLFGWTPGENEKAQPLAGRLCFNMAWSEVGRDKTHPVTLDILSGPKLSYYPFYLTKAGGGVGTYSDNNARPRGRKFYWHHPQLGATTPDGWQAAFGLPAPDAYKDEDAQTKGGHPFTDQNSTVFPCEQDVDFEGSLDFEGLEPRELGLLLWCLGAQHSDDERAQKHALKLGMGKPRGLGSVVVKGLVVTTYNAATRYGPSAQLTAEDGWSPVSDGTIRNWLAAFDNHYGLDDLEPLLAFGTVPQRPRYRASHYLKDEKTEEHHPDEGFAYFMAQKKRGSRAEALWPPQATGAGKTQEDVR